MQNNCYGINMLDKNVNISDRNLRRMSTSGFDYPKDVYNSQHPHNFPQISEAKYSNIFPSNINNFHTMNGDYEKKSEMANQNFFSENNVNLLNRNHLKTQIANTMPDDGSIPRFSSTPLIAQTSTGHTLHNRSHLSDVPIDCNPFFTSHSTFDGHMSSNLPNGQTGHSFPYMQSPYVLYDLRTNSYQNVILYSSTAPTITSNIEVNDENMTYYSSLGNHPETNDYQDLVDVAFQEPSDQNENYLKYQTPVNMESHLFSKYVEEDLMYFLPPELPNDITDINRAESQSMPSLHGDDIAESDDSSEDDQLNTVHGEEMLQELQKLSSVFTNVINLPMSRNNSTIGSTNFPCSSNLSRFKKTRIKERTTFWHNAGFIVNDHMVKIIPDIVLNIQTMDMDILDKLEMDIFGYPISKQADVQKPVTRSPGCIHSRYQCRSTPIDVRFLKHSNRTNQRYRSSFNSHSPTDLNNPLNQQIPSNISSRHSHRKSLQIPVRIPIWNPIIPMLSPVVQHRRMFFESANISNGKNSRRKRRWSLSGTKLEKNSITHSLRSHNHRQPSGSTNHVKYDLANEYSDNRYSFDHRDFDESNVTGNLDGNVFSNLESKLDNHLVALKRTVMSYMECNLSEIRDEVRSLRGTHVNLEKQLKYYKEKVHILEHSVRQTLPQEQWQLYGIIDSGGCQR